MKKRSLALLLPITAGIALSGTGFGLWVFKETEDFRSGLNVSYDLESGLIVADLYLRSTSYTDNVPGAGNSALYFKQSHVNAEEAPWKISIRVETSYVLLYGYSQYAKNESNDFGEEPIDYYDGSYERPTAEQVKEALSTYSCKLEIVSDLIAKDATEEETKYLKCAPDTPAVTYLNLKDMIGAGEYEDLVPDEDFTPEPNTGAKDVMYEYVDFKLLPSTLYNQITSPQKLLEFRNFLALDTTKIEIKASLVETASI